MAHVVTRRDSLMLLFKTSKIKETLNFEVSRALFFYHKLRNEEECVLKDAPLSTFGVN